MPDKGFIVLNHRLVDLEHHDDFVTAQFLKGDAAENPFKNWKEEYTNDTPEDFLLSSQDALEQYFDVIGERDNKILVACKAKLVIAADGINSVARKCIYRDSSPGWEKFAKPVYSGYVSLSVFGIPEISPEFSEEDLHEIRTKYLEHAGFALIACSKQSPFPIRLMLARMGVDDSAPLFVLVTVVTDESTLHTKSRSELAQMGLDTALELGVSPALERLFHTLAMDKNKERPINLQPFYVVPATHPPPYEPRSASEKMDYPEGFKRPWHHRRVVLVGDAAHASPNFKAQGVGQAAEDALNLTMRLEAAGVLDANCNVSEETLTKVFEQYRLSRLERASVHQESTLNGVSEYDIEHAVRMSQFFTAFDPTDIEGKRVVSES